MTTVNEIFEYLNAFAPVGLKMDFDNVGLLVGSGSATVSRTVIALDITDEVIDEAIELGAQLIISHHPLIFHAQKSILSDDLLGRRIIKLIKHDISAICMHTNLDIAMGGVNDALMETLGAKVTGILELTGKDESGNELGCGRVGALENTVPLNSFLKMCKEALDCNGLRFYDAGIPVRKLAVMGGSGGDCVALAKSLGCDTYVTADIKYNSFLDAKALGINLIDADHFCTENVVVPVLYEKLSQGFTDVSFFVSQTHDKTISFF